MRKFSFLVSAISLVFAGQVAAQGAPVTAEGLAGKTVYRVGSFGTIAYHYRLDGTFKSCGDARFWCDEGTWTFVDGKIVRVFKTWFQEENHRPSPVVVTSKDDKYSFGEGVWLLLKEGDKLPPGVIEDPRK